MWHTVDWYYMPPCLSLQSLPSEHPDWAAFFHPSQGKSLGPQPLTTNTPTTLISLLPCGLRASVCSLETCCVFFSLSVCLSTPVSFSFNLFFLPLSFSSFSLLSLSPLSLCLQTLTSDTPKRIIAWRNVCNSQSMLNHTRWMVHYCVYRGELYHDYVMLDILRWQMSSTHEHHVAELSIAWIWQHYNRISHRYYPVTKMWNNRIWGGGWGWG